MPHARAINAAGLEIIKRNEGLRLTAYQDTGGVWTIGWGHTPARPGQSISLDQAEALLKADIAWAEDCVAGATQGVPTGGNEFSAMVSLTFNIGPAAFRRSTVLRRHRLGDHEEAADAFLLWIMDNGRELAGLKRRRAEERALYLKPVESVSAGPAEPTDLGIRGAIENLQSRLAAAGHYPGEIDGDPGPLTIAALRAWRERR